MDRDQELRNAEREVERFEKIESLMRKPEWKEFEGLLTQLMQQELSNLVGQKLDGGYYKKIGFLKATAFIQELKNVLADKKQREYLMSQGRYAGWDLIKNLPLLAAKKRSLAMQRIQQIMGGSGQSPTQKREFAENVYRKEG